VRRLPEVWALDERPRTAHVASAHDNPADLSASESARHTQGGVSAALKFFSNHTFILVIMDCQVPP